MFGLASRVLTVSELTNRIRSALERSFECVWITGEISNLRIPASGHHYFTLKDASSQIRAVLFRGAAQGIPFALQDGLEVVAYGRVTVYEPRGDYQLVLESLEPKGIGALQLAFEQLKAKLTQEGLFDAARKRPLPCFPQTVGIVTSLSGAAIRDVLTVMHRRWPGIRVVVHPVPVQGDGAAAEIVDAIRTMNALDELDVLIVARGGGSVEDLWCFNKEPVVRAIANSQVPIVSAIGHEIDVTLSDFAADYRAPTPSAAAEVVVPRADEFRRRVSDYRDRMVQAVRLTVQRMREQVWHSQRMLPDPLVWLGHFGQRIDELDLRLRRAIRDEHGMKHRQCREWQTRLYLARPYSQLHRARTVVHDRHHRLREIMVARLAGARSRTDVGLARLQTASPLAMLRRGYSRVETLPDHRLVRKAAEVNVGDLVQAYLGQGHLICAVREAVSDA